MEALISIIVPVYKVEAYLDQCVSSIVNQTYKNLEILLVDDGSPDNCGAMCDAWAEKDSRIRVIHKENGGLSDARNVGMAAATGVYIGFVDSDDYIAPTMYEELLSRLTETGSDIAACGVQRVWEDGKTAMFTRPGSIILDNAAAMESILREDWLKQPVWYKLYRRDVTEGILFEKGKYHEDVFWSYQPMARAKRVCVFDTPLYFYRQRAGSIMGEPFSIKRLDALEAMQQRLQFLRQYYPQLAKRAETSLYFFCIHLCQLALQNNQDAICQQVKTAARQLHPTSPSMTKKEKMWFAFSWITWGGTCKLRNALKIGI